jgi:mono/diheme cytochrome c family protein
MERMQTRIWLKVRRAIPPGIVAVVLGVALLAAGCDVGSGGTATGPGAATPPPIPTTLMRGAAVFTRYCQVCHPGGDRGVGARLIGNPISDEQIKTVVRHGQKNMPAFSTETIPDDDLQNLVEYIRSLK